MSERHLVQGSSRVVTGLTDPMSARPVKVWMTTVHWSDCRYARDRYAIHPSQAERLFADGFISWSTPGCTTTHSGLQGCKVCGTDSIDSEFRSACHKVLEQKQEREAQKRAEQLRTSRLHAATRAETEFVRELRLTHADEIKAVREDALADWDSTYPEEAEFISRYPH
jgi:hypothetical protein